MIPFVKSRRPSGFNVAQPVLVKGEESLAVKTVDRTHELEWSLVFTVFLNLGFLPWAYGGMIIWSQWASAFLALWSFVLALLPRSYRPLSSRHFGYRRTSWPKLRSFPIFWIGAGLQLYLLVQALNPAFNYMRSATAWWLEPRPCVGWLPSGMTAPFDEMNTWRTLLIWITPWLTVCALWIGITRRRTIIVLLSALVGNAFVFGLFGLLQRASGTPKIYWSRQIGGTFFSAIIYKNHAAAFFGLFLLVALGLAFRSLQRTRETTARSSPGIVVLLFAAVFGICLLLSFSWSGVIWFGGASLLCSLVGVGRTFRRSELLPLLATFGLVGAILAGLAISVGSADFRQNLERKLSGGGVYSIRTRWLANECGWRMFKDKFLFGWGAGCFRYGFTKYQRAEPEIYHLGSTRLRWENVHNDWLELIIETGVVGASAVLAMGFYWIREAVRIRLWQTWSIVPLAMGVIAVFGYGWFDFPLHNPAIAALVCALCPLLIRWGSFEMKPPGAKYIKPLINAHNE